MKFLDMEEKYNPNNYIWYRDLSGWHKTVLNGEVILEIQGSEEGYWGIIRSVADDYERFGYIYSTKPEEGLHVPFKTPENCALTLDNAWKEIIAKEGKTCS